MPLFGYTKMFEEILSHPNIHVMLNADYKDIKEELSFEKLIYTGPIDEYFDFCYGKLPYRSIEFKFETLDQEQFQQTGTINYPNDYGFTRITEFKHLTGQKHHKTSIVYEYSKAEGDPYYPIPKPDNALLYAQYRTLAENTEDILFVGRLATYKYYNMDQVVESVIKKVK